MQQNLNYQHNEHNSSCYEGNVVLPEAHYAYDEVREYHDPWEDYYQKLEEQHNQMNTTANWQSNCHGDHDYDNEPSPSPPPPLPPTPPPQRKYVSTDDEVIEMPASIIEIVTHVDNDSQQTPLDNKSITVQTHSSYNHHHHTSSNNNSRRNSRQEEVPNNEPADCQSTIGEKRLETTISHELPPTILSETITMITTTVMHTDIPHKSTHIASDTNVEEESGLAGALSQLRLGEPRTPQQEAYEQVVRRQAWEQGEIDYTGKDSFDNIWKKITQTLESKPSKTDTDPATSDLITSADIEDGKIEYDPVTKAKIQYRVIDGGYEMVTTTPQPNGTVKTQTRTFWDPKPVSAEELLKEQENKRLVKKRFGKEIRIDSKTVMLTREIEGGYEEVYTVTNEDGTKSVKVKTFYDSVPEGQGFPNAPNAVKKQDSTTAQDKRKKQLTTRNSSVDSTDSTESRKVVQRKNVMQSVQDGKNSQTNQYQEESTFQSTRRSSQNVEFTQNSRTVRKNSTQEQNIQAISSTNSTDSKDSKKKTKKTKSSIPPPPSDFIENDTTQVSKKRVPGGVEYTYTTQLDSGKTITTSKTIYEEEETELTEEEIREYKKTLKDAEKHKNITSTKKLRSESGTKQVVPSENPGDVTTVETIRIEGGTEYHYTTVTSEGIVKKAVKTVYDPVAISKSEYESEEEEIVEDYEEEIIEPGEKNIRTIESVRQLPTQFQEEVTITKEKKEKKVKRSMVISN